MRKVFTTTIVIAMMLIASIAWSDIIHVPGDQPTIQAGIDVAQDGDTVMVADGTYTGEGNRDLYFYGKAITVTSENGAENCIIDCEQQTRGFNFHFGETSESVVSGFTIKNGYGLGVGGGIDCSSSSPLITDNIITNNSAGDNGNGGGIMIRGDCSPTIQHNIIEENFGGIIGGGIAVHPGGSPQIQHNTIRKNSASYGGGIRSYSSSPFIIKNIIEANDALLSGGGLSVEGGGTPTIQQNIIRQNYTGSSGGGIKCDSTSPVITNNIIEANYADFGGGGLYCRISAPLIINNTIVENVTEGNGGGIYCGYESFPMVLNTILWANSLDEIYVYSSAIGITVTYSDVQGGWEGEGNIDADPLFVDPGNGDFHLQPDSPCIDAGTPDGAPTDDIEGNPRDEFPDMGAYEYQGPKTGYIDGLVTDVDTAEPIERALLIAIQLPSKDKFFAPFTDEDGYYDISDLAPGLYLVIAIKKGYNPGVKIAKVVAGEGTWVEFWLTPKLE